MKAIIRILLSLGLIIALAPLSFAQKKAELADLIIVGRSFHTTGAPSFSGENILVPIVLRIENRRPGAAAGPFQFSIMLQYPPPAAPMESELEFRGTRSFSGLEPGRGIDVSGQIVFPKSEAGHKVKVRAIVDSMGQVSESSETNNASPSIEIQLPLELRRPPVEMKPKGAK
jgi:hypothetical protein